MELDLSIERGLERYEPILRAGLTAVGWVNGSASTILSGHWHERVSFFDTDFYWGHTDRDPFWNVDIIVRRGDGPMPQLWHRYNRYRIDAAPPHVQEIATKLHHIVLVLL